MDGCKWKSKKAGIVIQDKSPTRDKEGQYIMIKGSIQQQDVTFINIYASKTDKANISRSKGETATQWNNGYKDMLDQMDITYTEYSIENQRNPDSAQMYMEQS